MSEEQTKIIINNEKNITLDLKDLELKDGDHLMNCGGKWYVKRMYYKTYRLNEDGTLEEETRTDEQILNDHIKNNAELLKGE